MLFHVNFQIVYQISLRNELVEYGIRDAHAMAQHPYRGGAPPMHSTEEEGKDKKIEKKRDFNCLKYTDWVSAVTMHLIRWHLLSEDGMPLCPKLTCWARIIGALVIARGCYTSGAPWSGYVRAMGLSNPQIPKAILGRLRKHVADPDLMASRKRRLKNFDAVAQERGKC